MKLFGSPASPYVRNVRVLIHEKGLGDRIAWEPADPMCDPPELIAANPLGLVPTLVRDDGEGLFDSAVIANFVDTLAAPRLIPVEGEAGWAGARLRAVADGVLDVAVRTVQETRRPDSEQSPTWIVRWRTAIERAADWLERDSVRFERSVEFPALSVAVTLGYLDFRRPEIDWRAGRPRLTRFYAAVAQRPSLAATAPA